MRKRIILTVAVVGMLALALPASAGNQLSWAQETNRNACEATGAPIVSVTQHVTGDIDSGFNGGWAVDTYTRTIKLWEVEEGTYCAVVRYSGTFDAIPGKTSPGEGPSEELDGDENGNMQGGYRAIIEGQLIADPELPTKGTLGHFDYQCTDVGVCPDAINWVDQYFDGGYTFEYQFWGWIYRAGRHGIWVNASTGSSGNIH